MQTMFSQEEIKKLIKDSFDRSYELFQLGDLDTAEALCRQILRVDPENIDALHELGLIAHRNGKSAEAVDLLYKVLAIDPDKLEIYNSLSGVYNGCGEFDKAVKCLNRIIKEQPNNPHYYNNLGLTYQSTKEFDKAIDAFKKAIELDPQESCFYFNMGNVYGDQLLFKDSIRCYKKALSIRPDFNAALWNLSSALLTIGHWQEGWEAYETRWVQFEPFKLGRSEFDSAKEWNGKDSLKDKKIIVYVEQGLGDTFQFIRYAKLLKEMGAYVIFEAPSPKKFGDVVSLIQNQDYIDEVIIYNKQKPEHDYHVALTSCPKLFHTTVDSVPNDIPYLTSKETNNIPQEKWNDYKNFFKVGICWGGNPVHQRDCDRSCHLKHFQSLISDKVKLFSLQKDVRKRFWPGKGEIDLLEGSENMAVVDMSKMLTDFNETANIIKNMDLIITVDTALAHLAGALGKKVWLLTSYVPDWRWGINTEKSVWYPSMTIYRQPKWGDWDSVFTQVNEDLKKSLVMISLNPNS